MSARVLLQELPSGRILDWAVPLTGPDATDVLSGPRGLEGSLPEGYPFPVLEWGSALWVEDSGTFHGGGIVTTVEHQDRSIRVGCVGVTGYAASMPWLAPREDLINVDPLDIVRKIWDHLQSEPGGNVHLTVDPLTSPVRVGEEEREVEFTTGAGDDVSFETGPFRLNAVDTQDLAKTIDDLAASTPFDYIEHTYWDGENIRHRLELGHPSLGVRRTQMQFDTRVNLSVLPTLGLDEDTYASEVLLIGAGEGRDAITGHVPATPTRLRRVAVLADKSIRSRTAAARVAREELARRTTHGTVSDLIVVDTAASRINELGPGDTIHITGPLLTGAILDHWVRITEITRSLDDPSTAALAVIPAD
ncbi:MAG: hypothetical protein ACTIA5_01380 [Brachybacterium tyrofermentans]